MSAGISIILVVILVSMVLVTSGRIAEENEKHEMLMDVYESVAELDIVTYDYLLHREERMEHQWNIKHDSLGEILDGLAQEEELLPIRADYATLGNLFSQITVNYEERQKYIQEGASQERIDAATGVEERLVAQLLITSHSILTDASRLAKEAHTEATEAQRVALSLTVSLMIILAITVTTSSLLVARSISKPLDELAKGAEIIGKGDLEHRVKVKSKDELRELATAFNQMTENLSQNITERKRAQERVEHLSLVLRAVRNVNHLITKEKDRKKLLKGSCDNLTGTRGYYNAWIALLDESGKLTAHAESGLGKDFLPVVESLKRGQLLTCMQGALKQEEAVITEDPASACTDCPLSGSYAGRSSAIARLEYEGKVYGLLSVSAFRGTVTDVEELDLFHEVAADIAFALYNIEMEEKRKQAEEELAKYREHLEELVEQRTGEMKEVQEELLRSERLATLGQFSGSISHELRNPLAVIGSSVYYMEKKLEDADSKVLEHLGRIKSGVDKSTAIIGSLLNLTRMQAPRLEKLDSRAVISDAIASSKVPTGVEVVRNFPKGELVVNADGEQLRMAFKNIIRNAVEAMNGKGELTVTALLTPEGQAEVSFADTGSGIAAENLEKVFQPLFSTRAKGIGFGLSIARMIIDKHGGTIEARSEPGEGAVITIHLPAQEIKS